MKVLTSAEFRRHVSWVLDGMGKPYDTVNLDTLAELFEPAIDSGVGRVYGNFRANEKPSGFLCALFIVDPITGDMTAVEQLWYQVPGSGSGLPLFRAFESDAREKGCKRILCGCILNRGALGELYRRLGYSVLSETYKKEL